MTRINVIVKLQVEALHCWPGVVDHYPELSDVGFLQFPHRHIFHITAKKAVNHDDRDIEIILFKRNILRYLNAKYFDPALNVLQLKATSCEMLAKELSKEFVLEYCEVLEDGENGAEVIQTWDLPVKASEETGYKDVVKVYPAPAGTGDKDWYTTTYVDTPVQINYTVTNDNKLKI